jgi:hypothetical protein
MSVAIATAVAAGPQPPRLLEQLREAALHAFGRPEAGERDADGVRRYVRSHGKRPPRERGTAEVGRSLGHVAQAEKDPRAGLGAAPEALTFLSHDWLHPGREGRPVPEPPRLLDRRRRAPRLRQDSPRTERCQVAWAARFIRFDGYRHPHGMGGPEIERSLTDLAVNGHVAARTQNQAFNALLFLYGQVLGIELPRLDAVRPRRLQRLPNVLDPAEVRRLLDAIEGGDGVGGVTARRERSR